MCRLAASSFRAVGGIACLWERPGGRGTGPAIGLVPVPPVKVDSAGRGAACGATGTAGRGAACGGGPFEEVAGGAGAARRHEKYPFYHSFERPTHTK